MSRHIFTFVVVVVVVVVNITVCVIEPGCIDARKKTHTHYRVFFYFSCE